MKPSHVHFHSTSLWAAIRLVVSVLKFAITYAGQLAARAIVRACFTALASLLRICVGSSDNVLVNACAAVAKGTIPHRGLRSALWVAWSRTLVQAGHPPARLFLDLVALCSTMNPRVSLASVQVPATEQTQPATVKGTWIRPKPTTMLSRGPSQRGVDTAEDEDAVVVLYMHGGGFRIGNAMANTALFELLLHMWETMWMDDPVRDQQRQTAHSNAHTQSPPRTALTKPKSVQGSSTSSVRFADTTVGDHSDQEPLSVRLPRPASTGIMQPASVIHSCSQQNLAMPTDTPRPLAWFSLDYDLAPEYKWPTQIQQCLAAYAWLVAQGYSTVFLAGDSAGGNLALTTALCLRDSYAELPQPAGVLAFSPWTNLATDPTTYSEGDADILSWNPARHAEVVRAYLGDRAAELTMHPHVSPHMADMQGLPPLWICAGDVELLEPDIDAFVRKARAAGVPLTYVKGRGMYHSYATLYPLMGDAEGLLALQSCISFLALHSAA